MSARLRVILAAVCFSTGGTAIKWCGFGVWQLAAGRALIAACAITLFIPEARRSWSWRAALVGVAYAGAGLSFVLSNKLTTAASAIFIQATNPLFLLVLAPLLLQEHITRDDVAYMVALGAGLALLLSAPDKVFATAPQPMLGNLFAAVCAMTWALTVTGYRWLAKRQGDARGAVAAAAVSGNLVIFLIAAPSAVPLVSGTVRDWAVLGYLGVVQLGLAYVFLSRAITEVRALEASLLLLVEPVLSPLLAWLVHGETQGLLGVAGGAMILSATAVHAWRQAQVPVIPAPAIEG